MDWQPIETAPKDETPVLVYDGTEIVVACRGEELSGGQWVMMFGGQYLSVPDYEGPEHAEPEPTHWMPLPKPPPQ